MSKYNSKRIVTSDGVFDSKKEYRRWVELKADMDAGRITNLQRQVKYTLIPAQYRQAPGQKKPKCQERACTYLADFLYIKDGETIVEDVKGYRRGGAYAVFTIKRKLMLYVHNIKVKEI